MEVASHFSGEGHSVEDIRVIGLEKVYKNWVTYRRAREHRWMDLLGTYQRLGDLIKTCLLSGTASDRGRTATAICREVLEAVGCSGVF